MLILLAKGWTVVRRKITAQGRMKIATYFTNYFLMNVFAIYWAVALADPGQVIFFFDSLPGVILNLKGRW